MRAEVVAVSRLEPGVVQITMQDRQNRNMFSPQLVSGLISAFQQVQHDSDARVVILTGFDNYFCTGGTQDGLLELHAGRGQFTDSGIYSLALDCELPVIAAMQGHAIGGGFVLGLFADFVILSRESVYTTNFMKYGFTPGMGATLVLPDKLGRVLAEEMLLAARTYRGAELARRAIPFPVMPRAEFASYTAHLAEEIAAKPRRALVELKAGLTADLRLRLPKAIERELVMHRATFHLPEVRERIQTRFGK